LWKRKERFCDQTRKSSRYSVAAEEEEDAVYS